MASEGHFGALAAEWIAQATGTSVPVLNAGAGVAGNTVGTGTRTDAGGAAEQAVPTAQAVRGRQVFCPSPNFPGNIQIAKDEFELSQGVYQASTQLGRVVASAEVFGGTGAIYASPLNTSGDGSMLGTTSPFLAHVESFRGYRSVTRGCDGLRAHAG